MPASRAALSYRVTPIEQSLAEEVRISKESPDYKHPVHAEIAGAPAPCRVCLNKFVPGRDHRLLFTYDPFRDSEPDMPLPGPIYIHEQNCTPYSGNGLPSAIARDRLTFCAYGDRRELINEIQTADADLALDTVATLAADPRTRYVHVRSTPNGCFLFQLDLITKTAPTNEPLRPAMSTSSVSPFADASVMLTPRRATPSFERYFTTTQFGFSRDTTPSRGRRAGSTKSSIDSKR